MKTKGSDHFRGLTLPDYHGGSILNLLSSIIHARGGRCPHPRLHEFPAEVALSAKNIVYLVIDGLGEQQLQRYLGSSSHGFFAASPRRTITTVNPPTTAAAVTTFATGCSPAEHGILGWHLNLPDLGIVSTILLMTTRTGTPILPTDYDAAVYLGIPDHLATMSGRRELLSWRHIPFSRYSLCAGRWTRRRSYSTLEGLTRQITAACRRRGRGLIYAYWPQYDTLCHIAGTQDPRTRTHLEEIDQALDNLVRRLQGTDTLLLVTADHGLMDVPPSHRLDLANIPGLYDCLSTLPAGDPRQVHCFVRPEQKDRFHAIISRSLQRACRIVPGDAFLSAGLYGPGRPHPSLRGRIGDYVLLANHGWSLSSSLPGITSEQHAADHGGLSAVETLVPLFSVYC